MFALIAEREDVRRLGLQARDGCLQDLDQPLIEQGDGNPSQLHVWDRSEKGNTLRFQWRWYDQSKAFSIQPDMNIVSLELRQGDVVLRSAEERYQD